MSVILFFSNNCPHSVKFIEILKRSGEDGRISTFICVDKVRGVRPAEVNKFGILEVPTVVIEGRKKVGAEAFQWLSKSLGNAAQNHKKSGGRNKETAVVKAISGLQSGSMFDEYERVVGLDVDTSIYGNSAVPEEGKLEREDFFVMKDDNLAGGSNQGIPESNSTSTSQFDKAYSKLLEERNNVG